MKRKLLLSILAIVPAALMPLAAASQTAPASGERAEATYKYEVYAGYAYTSLNQVNQSRYGLQGFDASITRDWGKYFGVTADGAFYKYALTTGSSSSFSNPGTPTVDTVLLGPVIHAPLYDHVSGFIQVLLGGEHVGGEGMTPKVSFAGGFGGGLEYKMSRRISLRASGNRIGQSFSTTNNTAQLGNSAHKSWNASATVGAIYHF